MNKQELHDHKWSLKNKKMAIYQRKNKKYGLKMLHIIFFLYFCLIKKRGCKVKLKTDLVTANLFILTTKNILLCNLIA